MRSKRRALSAIKPRQLCAWTMKCVWTETLCASKFAASFLKRPLA